MFIFNTNKKPSVSTPEKTVAITPVIPKTFVGKALANSSRALSGVVSIGSALISLGTRMLFWGTLLSLGLRGARAAMLLFGGGSEEGKPALEA